MAVAPVTPMLVLVANLAPTSAWCIRLATPTEGIVHADVGEANEAIKRPRLETGKLDKSSPIAWPTATSSPIQTVAGPALASFTDDHKKSVDPLGSLGCVSIVHLSANENDQCFIGLPDNA